MRLWAGKKNPQEPRAQTLPDVGLACGERFSIRFRLKLIAGPYKQYFMSQFSVFLIFFKLLGLNY